MISHAFSQTIVDATGVITAFGTNGSTQTVNATDLVRGTDWNSAHQQLVTLAGNTAGLSALTGSNIVLAGGNNITVSGIQGANAATISLSGGTAAPAPINFSAGTATGNLTGIVFSNSNNVSFGLNGSTITASASVAASLTGVNLSAGTTSNNLSAFVFSNSNNVSFGLNGSTVTASVTIAGNGNTISYYANYINQGGPDDFGALTSTSFGNGSSYIEPFVLPANISAAFIRIIASGSDGAAASNSTLASATTATTITGEIHSTLAAGLFVQNTGASSLSLTRAFSATGGSTIAWALHAATNGTQYTITAAASYPVLGGTSAFSASYASTRTRYDFLTSVFSNFTGFVGLDFPFAISAAQSNYWLAIGASSVTSGTNLPRMSFNPFQLTAAESALANMGQATNASNGIRLGQGSFTSNAAGIPAALALSAITTQVSQGMLPFQMIRLA